MPWRLIGFILLFGIFLVFIAFNLGNTYTCDINFGFRVFHEVPVFLTAFASFVLGMLCAVPFVFSIRRKKKDKAAAGKEAQTGLPADTSGDPAEAKPRKKWGKKKEPSVDHAGIPEEGGPYGIN